MISCREAKKRTNLPMSLPKKKEVPNLHGDIVSVMPPNITENILSRLPIKEAVRTSILSKKWRYNWFTLPELVFDCSLGHPLINQNDKLVKFVNGVVLLHRGPICKFVLSRLWIPNSSDIDKWILCASRNGIQKLILDLLPQSKHYELPLCLYSCEQLTHMELSFCTLRRPPMFATFKSLRSLLLYKIDFVGFTFENLIARCPLLERLKIDGFTGSTDLIIYGPMLKDLVIVGFCTVMRKICFKNTPLLACVSLDLECFDLQRERDESSRLMNVVACLDGVEKLSVRGNFLKALSRKNTHPAFWEVHHGPECSLNHLQNVIITSFDGLRTQLEFIEFLLTVTPALEKMIVNGFKEDDTEGEPRHGPKMLEELMGLPRLSMEGKIEYFENGELVEFRK
ncbi:F-box/FBD/LRR-repeat protein At1g13570-like isoform X3 [Macadamia integrifolia]|uniref:F-box/FBD/LRR-repeat protein At1g13570-like isoform X3 n=1 Tax=Macadamia integrifolia TaxID=60698 RepID=UPI001C4F0959|nr:F-box/FBD/LRR-repeat protein At1g13570-like isoform X3 [Macadamia integrifolia]